MKLSTQISLGFLIAISIDLMDSYLNYKLTLKVNNDTEFLSRSEVTIRNSGKLNKNMVEMQSSFRGFLLTADEHFLSPYYDGLRTMPGLIKDEKAAASSSAQRQKLDTIEALHDLWVAYANSLIDARKKSIFDAAAANRYQYLFQTQLKGEIGKGYNDQIALLFNSFDQAEYRLREERRNMLSRSIRQTERFSLVFSILMIVIGTGTALFLVTKISRRIATLVRLAEQISNGNFTRVNDEKNDELSSLSVSLDAMSGKLSKNISDLKKKNDELNQFAYVVSHDLKAPVRGISNVIQWIDEDFHQVIPQKLQEFLDIIPERIKRMENLIDGLLEYARVGRDKAMEENVDVFIMIQELAEVLVPKDCRLIVGALPELWTEKLLLLQVFSNLLSNAVKYGRGEISVSGLEKGSFYEFTVSDNGPGIPRKYHEKVFVIFQTLREKNEKESTGVGLAIVKKIIEDQHCTIRISSSANNGTSFIFTWPKNRR